MTPLHSKGIANTLYRAEAGDVHLTFDPALNQWKLVKAGWVVDFHDEDPVQLAEQNGYILKPILAPIHVTLALPYEAVHDDILLITNNPAMARYRLYHPSHEVVVAYYDTGWVYLGLRRSSNEDQHGAPIMYHITASVSGCLTLLEPELIAGSHP